MRNDYETLLLERREQHVLVVTLNRPQRSNAFNTQMGLKLRDLFSAFYVDQEDVRCLILTGSGSKAFCAGADLKDRNEMTTEAWQQQHAVYEQMTRRCSTARFRSLPRSTALPSVAGASWHSRLTSFTPPSRRDSRSRRSSWESCPVPVAHRIFPGLAANGAALTCWTVGAWIRFLTDKQPYYCSRIPSQAWSVRG